MVITQKLANIIKWTSWIKVDSKLSPFLRLIQWKLSSLCGKRRSKYSSFLTKHTVKSSFCYDWVHAVCLCCLLVQTALSLSADSPFIAPHSTCVCALACVTQPAFRAGDGRWKERLIKTQMLCVQAHILHHELFTQTCCGDLPPFWAQNPYELFSFEE